MKHVYIWLAVVVAAIVGIMLILRAGKSDDGVACTMEAKLCPDGSSVGRVGPKCEFAECLVVSTSTNIKVFQPQPGEEVGQPLVIVGLAREFENTFNYQLLDPEGHVMAGGYATANAPDVGQFGAFSVALEYNFQEEVKNGFVKVFARSAKDGEEIDVVKIPVRFKNKPQTVVKAYFDLPAVKVSSDPDLVIEQCEGVFPVLRVVPKTVAVAKAAIKELLKGPTNAEQQAGYTTAINSGVKLQSVAVKNGVATVDFSSEFLKEFGGSCRVGLVTDQVAVTLKQFPLVQDVVILIDGRKDMIQP